MDLTPQEREQIYREEKAMRKSGCHSRTVPLLLMNLLAAAAVALIYTVGSTQRSVKLEDLRKAYPGLDPEEMQ
jgi:hypothetical protein